MAHDVFISYASPDKPAADAACAILEAARIRCWIAPRDILPGRDWGEAIITAIEGCSVMLLVFSAHANNSVQIKREVERAVGKGKILIPMRIEEVQPTQTLEYFLGTPHWLDAFSPPLEKHLHRLVDVLHEILRLPCGAVLDAAAAPRQAAGSTGRWRQAMPQKLAMTAALAVILGVGLAVFERAHFATPPRVAVAQAATEAQAAAVVPAGPADLASRQRCDLYAASQYDTHRAPNVAAVATGQIDTAMAASACAAALSAYPTDPRLQYELGRVRLDQFDTQEAVRLYQLAADAGFAPAQLELGTLYEAGRGGLHVDKTRAAYFYKLAADQGLAEAQYRLGGLYEAGIGVPAQDVAKAVSLYQLAASQGLAEAQFSLGGFYHTGQNGLPKDDGQAVRLITLAANQGLAEAQYVLGTFYEVGLAGLPVDRDRAVNLYQSAARQGDLYAQQELNQLGKTW